MAEGKLVVNAKKQIRVRFTNSKGKEVEMAVPDAELSATLKREPVEQLNGRDVELNEEKGQPRRVRPVGEPLAAVAAPPVQRQQQGERGQKREGAPSPRHRQGKQPGPQVQGRATRMQSKGAFHNPYNFVPALPRGEVSGELSDREPVGHHTYHADRVSGVVRVKMTAVTPLLLPDAAKRIDYNEDQPALVIKRGHKSFPVRVDDGGKPYVPPTSIKGMLRSAYEAVTNSRLAVFSGHEDRLGRRMVSNEGLGLVPCRIEGGNFRLLPGTSIIAAERPNGPMYAAWLPSELLVGTHRSPFVPNHRDAVSCWIELWVRTPWNRRQNRFEPHNAFQYWKVLAVGPASSSLPCPTPSAALPQSQGSNHHTPVAGMPLRAIIGFACITEYNFDRKYNERVFFEAPGVPLTTRTPAHDKLWRNLISDYRTNQDLQQGRPRPSALRQAGWSRHMTDNNELELSDGTLAYALVEQDGASWQVLELFPVCISRRLYTANPQQLLEESLLPAYWIDRLSPADRVFGWVRQADIRRKKERPDVDEKIAAVKAYRGNLRVGPVTCESPDAIEHFGEPGLPLAILGQPKEQQARFYVAASQEGEAQKLHEDGTPLSKEEAGYGEGKGLRGRKVYPHHRSLSSTHWDEPLSDRTQVPNGGHFQEYRRPDSEKVRDSQNRSIRNWVKPDTVFTFDLHVTNLSNVELGALLWLLSLSDEHYHRLGGGKPLGFGSVRLEIDASKTCLHDGNGWKDFYSTLDSRTLPEVDREAIVKSFQEAVIAAYGPNLSFGEVSFIKAFLLAAKGFEDNLPIHYPRARQRDSQGKPIPGPVPPNPAGEAFQWFVANERTGGTNPGPQVCLSDLADDQGLPMLDAPR